MEVITASFLLLPHPYFCCPICGAQLCVVPEEWEQTDEGVWQVTEGGMYLECTTEPDIDAPTWREWHCWHYRMPYVDWLPLDKKVLSWINARYCWQRPA